MTPDLACRFFIVTSTPNDPLVEQLLAAFPKDTNTPMVTDALADVPRLYDTQVCACVAGSPDLTQIWRAVRVESGWVCTRHPRQSFAEWVRRVPHEMRYTASNGVLLDARLGLARTLAVRLLQGGHVPCVYGLGDAVTGVPGVEVERGVALGNGQPVPWSRAPTRVSMSLTVGNDVVVEYQVGMGDYDRAYAIIHGAYTHLQQNPMTCLLPVCLWVELRTPPIPPPPHVGWKAWARAVIGTFVGGLRLKGWLTGAPPS